MGNPEVIFASDGPNGLSIRKEGSKHGVFLAGKPLDWFSIDQDARDLLQDLSLSRIAFADDPLIGKVKFCGDPMGNGRLVIVVAKGKDGYTVQQKGTTERFEVIKDELTDPPNYNF